MVWFGVTDLCFSFLTRSLAALVAASQLLLGRRGRVQQRHKDTSPCRISIDHRRVCLISITLCSSLTSDHKSSSSSQTIAKSIQNAGFERQNRALVERDILIGLEKLEGRLSAVGSAAWRIILRARGDGRGMECGTPGHTPGGSHSGHVHLEAMSDAIRSRSNAFRSVV